MKAETADSPGFASDVIPNGFDITHTVSAKRHVVTTHGELDLATAPVLDAHLRALLAAEADIVLDLSALSFIAASGIAVLVSNVQAAAHHGTRFEVRGARPPVVRALELCGVAQRIGITQ